MIISTFRVLPYCLASTAKPSSFSACHESATARSHNLRGRSLGLVGLGNIGQQIALKAGAAFAMDVIYYDGPGYRRYKNGMGWNIPWLKAPKGSSGLRWLQQGQGKLKAIATQKLEEIEMGTRPRKQRVD